MYSIQSGPPCSHPKPDEATEDIPLQDLAPTSTGISDRDDQSNRFSEAPILAASRNGNLNWMKALLNEDPALVSQTAPSGISKHPVSPLHITANEGHVEATKYLLDTALQDLSEAEKADVAINLMTLRFDKKTTPFYFATLNANVKVAGTFLKCLLALPETDISRALVAVMNAARKDSETPLCSVIKRGDDQMVHLFMQSLSLVPEAQRADTIIGVLAPEKQGKGNWQPLHLAASLGRSSIIKLMLDTVSVIPEHERSKVVRQVVNATDARGATPLLIAVQGNFGRIVDYILSVITLVPPSEMAELTNALVNSTDKNRETPLYAAASKSYRHILATLLEQGADPELARVRCVPGRCRRSNSPHQLARQGGSKTKGLLA
ncbi:ankyrin repeat domain-containing protein, partial [Endozoicomonas sp. ONNA2]|uniref:ankyrin repeat domain-containing protein n=1 Tax=Endozoicomonas sp. ONNA2 TaxID=2828741 RepID=UPI0021491B79